MSSHDLHDFLAQVTNGMSAEYDRIYKRAAQDPGTAGDEGEGNWAKLFKEWLPPNFHVETKGRLIGHDGRVSPQIDVVILKPAYPKKLLEKKIWLAGGVAAVFECKTTLKKDHILDSIKRCEIFKDLYPARTGSPRRELRSPLIYGLLAHSHSWKGAKSKPVDNADKALNDRAVSASHPRFELDFLCVADLATWSNQYITTVRAMLNYHETLIESLGRIYPSLNGPVTSYRCHNQNINSTMTPIGALLTELLKLLAWDEPGIRDIARYFGDTGLIEASEGDLRPWPSSVYSEKVVARVGQSGGSDETDAWDEWTDKG